MYPWCMETVGGYETQFPRPLSDSLILCRLCVHLVAKLLQMFILLNTFRCPHMKHAKPLLWKSPRAVVTCFRNNWYGSTYDEIYITVFRHGTVSSHVDISPWYHGSSREITSIILVGMREDGHALSRLLWFQAHWSSNQKSKSSFIPWRGSTFYMG